MPRLSENAISFFGAGGHKHDGVSSTLISTASYSLFDFNPGYIGSQSRISIQQTNQTALEEWVMNIVNTKVLAPAGLDLAPGLLSGKSIRANTITAVELQANTITASEIAAGTITANQLSSNIILVNNVIRSNNYNGTIAANGAITASGNAGWAITSFGSAEFANTSIRGALTANSVQTPGIDINSDGSISSTNFNVTANGNITANNANITGTITSGSGTIGGWAIGPSAISAGSTVLYSNGYVSAAIGSFSGAIAASSGTFNGTITSGGAHFGVMVPGSGYYKGINLSPDSNTQFQSCFLRGDGGEVYLRADNGTQWIKFENGSVQINTPGFSVSGTSASFAGSISASTITGSTLSTTDGTNGLLITSDGYLRGTGGNGVRIQNSDGTTGSTKFFKNSITTDDISTNLISITPNGTNEVNIDPSGTAFDIEVTTGGIQIANGKTIRAVTSFKTTNSGTSARVSQGDDVGYDNLGRPVSLRELKENIGDIEDALGILSSLTPRIYNFRVDAFSPEDPLTQQPWTEEARDMARLDVKYGFLVDEVLSARPELVSYSHENVTSDLYAEGGYLDFNSWRATMWEDIDVLVLCVKAIQELSSKVELLEVRIQTLEGV